jgi:hypothetical protein
MARQREPPPYRDHLLDARVQTIESLCRGAMYSGAGVAGAGADACTTPTYTTDMLAVRERQALQLIAAPPGSGQTASCSATSGNS